MAAAFDVFLSHNSKDKMAVRELAESLRARGIKVWLDEWELVPGRPWQQALEEVIEFTRSAAVLVGRDGLGPWQDAEMRGALVEFVERALPVIPVLLPGAPDKVVLPIFLKNFTWVDLRAGISDEKLDILVWGITGTRGGRGPKSIPENQVAYTPRTVRPRLQDVFNTVGLPRYTYVEPGIYRRFYHDLTISGKHTVLEGPSGVGKTCLVFRALEELGLKQSHDYTYTSAREDGSISKILTLFEDAGQRINIIDDVHMLAAEFRNDLANRLKLVSDGIFSEREPKKFVLIGIPTASAGLLHDATDLGPRLGTFKLGHATEEQLRRLINEGEERLSIRFRNPEVIITESGGSFFLCQYICHTICFNEEILEAQSDVVVIRYQIEEIRRILMEELEERFYQHVLRFCKGATKRPESALGFIAILASLARLGKSVVYLSELLVDAGPYSSIVSEAANLLASPDSTTPGLAKLIHYDQSIEAFSIEDPALKYYLKNLDIAKTVGALGIRDTGFKTYYAVPSSPKEYRPPANAKDRDLVFISYSHADLKWVDMLRSHLSPFVGKDGISLWSDDQIRAGTNWLEEIDRAIASTKVAVLLVSADYLASDFITSRELPLLLEGARRQGLRILWILLRDCLWEESPLASYQAVLSTSEPIASLPRHERDRAFVEISRAVARALRE